MTVRDLFELVEKAKRLDNELVIHYIDNNEVIDFSVDSVKYKKGRVILEIFE